ncbi:MAG TPA: 16S rRNA (adenine(1518)-N(6)/adenine(1519)-N(6))-dimethyltransferase RsmA, partial [Candidatus Eisenbacteria bacterium]
MHHPAPSFTSKESSATTGRDARSEPHATTGVAGTLRALDVRPSRRLGQNFLSDPRVAERIAAVAREGIGAAPTGPILEIGPGLGALTERLAASGRPFVAVELDLRLAEHIESLLRPYPNARVVRGDILDQRLDALVPGGEPVTVVANLPYAITSPAIAWILEQGPRVARAVLMTQREVAQRLAAKPGTKEHGSFTVFLALHAELRVEFRVSPGAFHPRPDVDSVVFTVIPRPYPGTTAAERAAVERIVRAATGGRRKTLANSLGHGLDIGAER